MLLAGATWAAAVFPLQLSLVAVFLFAGPHNVVEARYFLTRMPARWGRLTPYFVVGLGGAALLTGAYLLLFVLAWRRALPHEAGRAAICLWCSLLVLWVGWLAVMRRRQPPCREWSLAAPLALALAGGAWLVPQLYTLGLVYLHPLLGLWLLDRELLRSRPNWRRGFRMALATLPLAIGFTWWQGGWMMPELPSHPLRESLANHAGASLLPWASSRILVSTHALLELLHYGVWLIGMPLASGRVWTWNWSSMPATRRAGPLRWLVAILFVTAALAVVALWIGFSVDYATTRDVYFAIATFHVLAEFPFLIRSL